MQLIAYLIIVASGENIIMERLLKHENNSNKQDIPRK